MIAVRYRVSLVNFRKSRWISGFTVLSLRNQRVQRRCAVQDEGKKRDKITTVRLTEVGRDMLIWLSEHLGIPANGVVEIAVRRFARAEGYGEPALDRSNPHDSDPNVYKHGL